MSKRIDEQMLLRAEPILAKDKTIDDLKDIKIELNLLDKDKKPLNDKALEKTIPKAEETESIKDVLAKYNSTFKGKYIIKYETSAKDVAKDLGILETDEKYKQISYLSFRIDANCNGKFDKSEAEKWFDVIICKGITKEMLVAMGCIEASKNQELIEALNKYCCQYEINTPLRIAHFLAQAGHESGGFTKFKEDDKYKESIAIKNSCYKKYRETPTGKALKLNPRKNKKGEIVDYDCKQPEYFNCKYGAKNGNETIDNENPNKKYYYQIDDGHKFRGRGLIHITGREKYQGFTEEHNRKNPNDNQNFIDNPDLVSINIDYSVASACYWWINLSARGGSVNKYADKGSSKIDVYNVSWCVNARQKQEKPFMPDYKEEANGLEDRWNKFEKIAKHLGLIK